MKDYHDYVIKDGRFIGEFNQMYADCDDPWHQSESTKISYSRWDTIFTLKKYAIHNALECGCGLGYFTKLLSDYCADSCITGMDISENAINRAQSTFPDLHFQVGNINQLGTTIDMNKYDCLIFSEIMWYVLKDLSSVISILKSNYRGLLVINQVFYRGGEQKYGKDFFTNEKEMVTFLGLYPIVQNKYELNGDCISYETHNVFQLASTLGDQK